MYIADFEVLAFFVLLFISIYMRIKYAMETDQNREFLRLVVCLSAADFNDVLGAWAINLKWQVFLLYFFNTGYFFFCTLTAYIFLFYCTSFYYKDRQKKVSALKFNQYIFAVYLALLIVNIPTGIFFSFSTDGAYISGPAFSLILLFAAFYLFENAFLMIRHRAAYSRHQFAILMLFTILTIVLPVCQLLFYRSYLTNFYFGTVMVFMVLLSMETPDEQELNATIENLDRLKEELEQMVDEDTKTLRDTEQQLKNLTLQLSYALTSAIDAKDRYTSGHSARVASYSRMLSARLGMSEEKQQDIYLMGLLHDVGKIGVSNKIINKPGKLTDEEYGIMKQHPVIGYKILSKITLLPEISTGARWHHERQDGRGYPDGLTAGEIPYEAQIIAVADAYDAMTSYRSYRGVMPQKAVREQVEKGKGTQFNPRIADCMLELIDEDADYRMHEMPHDKDDTNVNQ